MSKKILSGASVKVENRSSFDKSRLHGLSTFVGTITPILKQLCIPGHVHCAIDLHSVLPPLAFDAYLRSHLKVEGFFVPFRLGYGGFESWFCGKELYDSRTNSFIRAKLPRLYYNYTYDSQQADTLVPDQSNVYHGGACSLLDYFGVDFDLLSGPGSDYEGSPSPFNNFVTLGKEVISGKILNIFPALSYQLIYDEWYRKKEDARPYIVRGQKSRRDR